MSPFRRSREQDHLGRYWDAVVHGVAAEELGRLARPLDPQVIDIITRTRTLRQVRPPRSAFIQQLERDLVREFTATHTSTVPQGQVAPGSLNGLFPPSTRGLSGAP